MSSETILDRIKSTLDPQEIEKIIREEYPEWLICSLEKYSDDYPHLQTNWETICTRLGTNPKKIVLVSEITFENPPSTLNKICDYITSHGYCVRRCSEFLACPACEKAIPCIEIWNLLKERGIKVPETWENKCKNCLL